MVDKIVMLNEKYNGKAKVIETYGSLPFSFIPTGRLPKKLPSVDNSTLEKHISLLHKHDIKINYLMNASCMGGFEGTYDGIKQLKSFLSYLSDIGVDIITVANPFIIDLISNNFNKMKANVSTILGISSYHQAKVLKEMGADRITVDVDINRDFKVLKELQQIKGVEWEIMVNSKCRIKCPFKNYHYNCISHGNNIENEKNVLFNYIGDLCSKSNFDDAQSYLKLGFIRPNDLSYYRDIGFNIFKIVGRQSSEEKIINVLEDYMQGYLTGDINKIFLEWASGKEIFNNEDLDGFLDNFIKENCRGYGDCTSCNYCLTWSEKLNINMNKDQNSFRSYFNFDENIENRASEIIENVFEGKEPFANKNIKK